MIVRDIERAFKISIDKDSTNPYGGLSLSEGALFHIFRRLEKRSQPYNILELGGGKSTIFLQSILELDLLPIRVSSIEHDIKIYDILNKYIDESNSKDIRNYFKIHLSPLKQITDEDKDLLFADPMKSLDLWSKMGEDVPKEQYNNYAIKNVFYTNIHDLELEEYSIDILIVDGPHGNGRSLAYPLLAPFCKKGTLILVDDFDHYPFIEDLKRVFKIEESFREIDGDKHWVLVKVVDYVNLFT